jgi:hypothetical protein
MLVPVYRDHGWEKRQFSVSSNVECEWWDHVIESLSAAL